MKLRINDNLDEPWTCWVSVVTTAHDDIHAFILRLSLDPGDKKKKNRHTRCYKKKKKTTDVYFGFYKFFLDRFHKQKDVRCFFARSIEERFILL